MIWSFLSKMSTIYSHSVLWHPSSNLVLYQIHDPFTLFGALILMELQLHLCRIFDSCYRYVILHSQLCCVLFFTFNPLNPDPFLQCCTADPGRFWQNNKYLMIFCQDLQQNTTGASSVKVAKVIIGLYLVTRNCLLSQNCPKDTLSNK